MRILVDIGHPGHVHLFRHAIAIMRQQGHEFLITARDKEVSLDLLKAYNLPYINRGKGYKGVGGKIAGSLIITAKIIRQARKFRPDILLGGVGNVYIALAAFVLRKPSVICDDTEHATLELSIVRKFATCILTPDIYRIDLGKKQIRYAGYHEIAYLHPKYFQPNAGIRSVLGLRADEPYIVLRFVAWGAGHDRGLTGLPAEEKLRLVKALQAKARVFISAEAGLPSEIEPLRLRIRPEQMHDVLAGAVMFIGEGATMASESVCLGVPTIYTNQLVVGYCAEQAQAGLLFHETQTDAVLKVATEIMTRPGFMSEYRQKHDALFLRKIDVTAFLIWFLTTYPESQTVARKNPDFQQQFLGK